MGWSNYLKKHFIITNRSFCSPSLIFAVRQGVCPESDQGESGWKTNSTTGVNFNNQFAQCTEAQAWRKWCKRCCSVSPTFLLIFYCIFLCYSFCSKRHILLHFWHMLLSLKASKVICAKAAPLLHQKCLFNWPLVTIALQHHPELWVFRVVIIELEFPDLPI